MAEIPIKTTSLAEEAFVMGSMDGPNQGPHDSFRLNHIYISVDISAIYQWILLQYGSF